MLNDLRTCEKLLRKTAMKCRKSVQEPVAIHIVIQLNETMMTTYTAWKCMYMFSYLSGLFRVLRVAKMSIITHSILRCININELHAVTLHSKSCNTVVDPEKSNFKYKCYNVTTDANMCSLDFLQLIIR